MSWIRDIAFISAWVHSSPRDRRRTTSGAGSFAGTLPDETGVLVFIAAHVPLFAVLIALVASKDERVRRLSRLVMRLPRCPAS
jgi:hypothetical protein